MMVMNVKNVCSNEYMDVHRICSELIAGTSHVLMEKQRSGAYLSLSAQCSGDCSKCHHLTLMWTTNTSLLLAWSVSVKTGPNCSFSLCKIK